jgi:hypothetical protein
VLYFCPLEWRDRIENIGSFEKRSEPEQSIRSGTRFRQPVKHGLAASSLTKIIE